ncbi:MAG: D-alanyl-D-alanine carboxypeptidase/D-alanyl-D-alanine-endopeptidase, partial [Acidobacteria bacterium]|nr:D-alanyl-D-alanine carboxypeptidase/D-alanyl-D-alanine-endopeptidase [Acidobacteriota bacterium]
TRVSRCLKRPGIRSTQWGMEVIDTSNDEVLLSLNPDKPFTPGSVAKVLTTAAALEKLGPDFRFRTGVYTSGTLLPDGTLSGDLYLVGRGDPHLSATSSDPSEKSAFRELAEKLSALGIRRVQGQIIGDDSYFDASGDGSGWTSRELKARYGAPISALSINNNLLSVNAWPGKLKQSVAVGLEPRSSCFRIRNLAVTGSRRSRRSIHARLISGTRTIVVSGVLPAGQSYSRHLPLDQPAVAAAGVLMDELRREGIAVDGGVGAVHSNEVARSRREELRLLAEHQSLPLIHALETINKDSQNLHAEMLLRTLGAEVGSAGTDEAGLQVVNRFLLEAGIESRQVSLSDGCGLSRENLLTPRFQTSLLKYLSTQPYFGLFLNTLAVSGTDGTLKHRMVTGPARGVVYAKTGTLNGVSTLSGYMTTASGRQLIFSIFANNARASMKRIRRTIDEICSLLVNLY